MPELRELAVTSERVVNNENQITERLNETRSDIEGIRKNQENTVLQQISCCGVLLVLYSLLVRRKPPL